MKRTLLITGALTAALTMAATMLAPANANIDASHASTAKMTTGQDNTGQRTRYAQYNCMHFAAFCTALCRRRQDYSYCHNFCMLRNGCRPML